MDHNIDLNYRRKIRPLYVYDKHNMNLVVLIFLKTYVCKHESKHKRKHIEPKPAQKNCSIMDTKCANFALLISCICGKNNETNWLIQGIYVKTQITN